MPAVEPTTTQFTSANTAPVPIAAAAVCATVRRARMRVALMNKEQ